MSRFFLFLTVFITGMAVMAVELTASRLLAPYFGASLFVWTNIIGVVMAALALGYFVGGKLADRNNGATAQKILYPIILATGVFITLIPFVGKPVFLFAYGAIERQNLSIFLGSLVATLVLFLIPFFLLGMVSPLAARLSFKKMDSAGSTVGSLYAFSTLGSIVGTFLPVLVTIPFLGSRETFFLFGGMLIMLGVFGLRKAILLGLLILPIALFFIPSSIHAHPDLIYEGESVYNYIRVFEDDSGARALLTNEGVGVQSLYHPRKNLTGYYWDAAAFLQAINPNGKKFLILGTAGASSARILHHFYPQLELAGVEIDPLMIQTGKRFFNSDEIPMQIHENDGRMFLANTKEKYDFIMVDVYRDELYIPFHLATKEFFELVKSRLEPNGSMMMNIASVSTDSELLTLIKNTVTDVFPFTYELREENSYNSLIFAFKAAPDFSTVSLDKFSLELQSLLSKILRGITLIANNPSGEIALDNRSPVEFLTEKMVLSEAI
ncbi:fused MFS/spermidine synthase [Candidatus Peregrinibacteria bacterium]|nr:fused MFS/spermidine synthase [Candidatus Peregrinibacteria bacterium]